jgi:hypothetical protein
MDIGAFSALRPGRNPAQIHPTELIGACLGPAPVNIGGRSRQYILSLYFNKSILSKK